MNESFTIHVNPAKPWFSMLATSAKKIVRGEKWAVCYSTEHAVSVRLEPTGQPLPIGKNKCFMLQPAQTTDFRIVAKGEGGDTIVEKLRVAVVTRN